MLTLIAGLKGSGKTKLLVERANQAVDTTKGCVVVIEQGPKLMHEIKYQARRVDTDEYGVCGADALYGLLVGTYASNHDVTHIFVDSALKICGGDMKAFGSFMTKTGVLAAKHNIQIFVTASCEGGTLPDEAKKYLVY